MELVRAGRKVEVTVSKKQLPACLAQGVLSTQTRRMKCTGYTVPSCGHSTVLSLHGALLQIARLRADNFNTPIQTLPHHLILSSQARCDLRQAAIWLTPLVARQSQSQLGQPSLPLTRSFSGLSYPQGRQMLGGGDYISTQVKLVNLPENYDVYVVHIIVPNLRERRTLSRVQELLPNGSVPGTHNSNGANSPQTQRYMRVFVF